MTNDNVDVHLFSFKMTYYMSMSRQDEVNPVLYWPHIWSRWSHLDRPGWPVVFPQKTFTDTGSKSSLFVTCTKKTICYFSLYRWSPKTKK